MDGLFRRPVVRLLLGIVGAGILLGFVFAVLFLRSPNVPPPAPSSSAQGGTNGGAFGDYFTLFTLGRSTDPNNPSSIGKNTIIVPSSTFLEKERVGIRVNTASSITRAFRVQVRFLTSSTNEETAALRAYRREFTVQPGLSSYCCVTIPKGVGSYVAAIVVNDAFIGRNIPFIVKPEKRSQTGGLLAPAQ